MKQDHPTYCNYDSQCTYRKVFKLGTETSRLCAYTSDNLKPCPPNGKFCPHTPLNKRQVENYPIIKVKNDRWIPDSE